MKKYRTDARLRKCEQLEDRRLLAADLGVELSSIGDLESESVVVSSEVGEVAGSGSETDSTQVGSEAVATSDAVLAWNNLFNELLVADEVNQNPGYASRAMAMLNLAIYDAVTIASGDPNDAFYDYDSLASTSLSKIDAEVAASHAAYTVLSSLYPDQQSMIDSFLERTVDGVRPSANTAASVALGTEIGNQILANRANDGSDAIVDYTYTDGIGNFQADPLNPDVPVWGPGWGQVDTFAVSSAEDFAPETTPPITSEEYAASYNEVLELGSVDSTVRTADQTEAGIFWAYDRVGLGTPLSLFNDILESIAVQQGNTLEENAALYAQASVAMADAAIVAWHTKFDEEFWRPVTAIHDGDIDGNPLTDGDEGWTALGAPDGEGDIIGFTPQFPTYISGHATFGGALFGALQEFYGTDDIAFEVSSMELEILLEDPELQEAYGLDLDDATRSFDTLSEAMAENGRSRVYLGIHFDFDDLVGQEVGQAVAQDVASEFVVAANDDAGGRNHLEREDRRRDPDTQPGRQRRPRNMRSLDTGMPATGNSMGRPQEGPSERMSPQPAQQLEELPGRPTDDGSMVQRRGPRDTIGRGIPPTSPNRDGAQLTEPASGTDPNVVSPDSELEEANTPNRTSGHRRAATNVEQTDRSTEPAVGEELPVTTEDVDRVYSEFGEPGLTDPMRQPLNIPGGNRRARG